MEGYWETTNGHAPHPVKFEREASAAGYTYCNEPGLNFSTSTTNYSEDDADFAPGRRGKTSRQDPLSHRIIEKRRRDRMNSCLADLSRLIPQQYMRKGRGRVEKTEIIEMAIRHLKNLQNQECINRESLCAEQYRLGYHDCLTEAAKFMLRERGEEMCFRMVAHLKENCNEIMKGEYLKSRCGTDGTNGNSQPYLQAAPLSQLRDMLACPSDIEHSNSNDHHDVKDLSFRTNNPPQAAVITSTAPSVQHIDTSSNQSTQDYETSSPPRISTTNIHLHQDSNNNINHHESVLRTIRMRKFSDAFPEHEHNHNSYKFKNYIQQRFSQDNHLDNGLVIEVENHGSPTSNHHLSDDQMASKNQTNQANNREQSLKRISSLLDVSAMDEDNPLKNGLTEIKNEVILSNSQRNNGHSMNGGNNLNPNSFAIPIFACHTQGFYIPLNVDYESLLPYLNGIDMMSKHFTQVPPLHPININVHYAPSLLKTNNINNKTKMVEGMVNGW